MKRKSSRKYVTLKVPLGIVSHRSRNIAEAVQESLDEFFSVPWDRDDPDWKVVYKYNKVGAVALLHRRAKLIRCTGCRQVEIRIKRQMKYVHPNFWKVYKCVKCRGLKDTWSDDYKEALNNLQEKVIAEANRGVKITKLKE